MADGDVVERLALSALHYLAIYWLTPIVYTTTILPRA